MGLIEDYLQAKEDERRRAVLVCSRKVKFPHKDAAYLARLLMEERYEKAFYEYQCATCEYWHVGGRHSKSEQEERKQKDNINHANHANNANNP